MFKYSICLFLSVLVMSCNSNFNKETFGNDLEFLKRHINPIILKDGDRQIIVSSEYQGRIFTSTSKGLNGLSYGWFNKEIIAADVNKERLSSVGGASRIWFGPDEGPHSIFVGVDPKTNEKVKMAPKDLDIVPFKVINKSATAVSLKSNLHLENTLGFDFYLDVDRKIELLNSQKVASNLNIELPKEIDYVAFSAKTSMTNIGNENWSKDKGLIALWELGCMYPTPETTVVIPLKGNPKNATIYFTPIDSTRITIKDNILFYKADAEYLNKIGTLPEYTLPYFGSYSPELNRLTIVRFSFDNESDFVNSHPENIENQYRGDVINIFNDGTWREVGPFGPFYELETSSQAKALKVNESLSHTHETYHFDGSKEALNAITVNVFGVTIETIEKALP